VVVAVAKAVAVAVAVAVAKTVAKAVAEDAVADSAWVVEELRKESVRRRAGHEPFSDLLKRKVR
jgi:hypothetical protein